MLNVGDRHLDRDVALKVLLPEALGSIDRRRRFVLEAEITGEPDPVQRSAEASSPYSIVVTPGNAKVPRGGDRPAPNPRHRLLPPVDAERAQVEQWSKRRGSRIPLDRRDHLHGLSADQHRAVAADVDRGGDVVVELRLAVGQLRWVEDDQVVVLSVGQVQAVFALFVVLDVLLLNAGHETTTNLIGNGLKCLLDWPDEKARLLADPALMRTAIEEFLRFVRPQERPQSVAELRAAAHAAGA